MHRFDNNVPNYFVEIEKFIHKEKKFPSLSSLGDNEPAIQSALENVTQQILKYPKENQTNFQMLSEWVDWAYKSNRDINIIKNFINYLLNFEILHPCLHGSLNRFARSSIMIDSGCLINLAKLFSTDHNSSVCFKSHLITHLKELLNSSSEYKLFLALNQLFELICSGHYIFFESAYECLLKDKLIGLSFDLMLHNKIKQEIEYGTKKKELICFLSDGNLTGFKKQSIAGLYNTSFTIEDYVRKYQGREIDYVISDLKAHKNKSALYHFVSKALRGEVDSLIKRQIYELESIDDYNEIMSVALFQTVHASQNFLSNIIANINLVLISRFLHKNKVNTNPSYQDLIDYYDMFLRSGVDDDESKSQIYNAIRLYYLYVKYIQTTSPAKPNLPVLDIDDFRQKNPGRLYAIIYLGELHYNLPTEKRKRIEYMDTPYIKSSKQLEYSKIVNSQEYAAVVILKCILDKSISIVNFADYIVSKNYPAKQVIDNLNQIELKYPHLTIEIIIKLAEYHGSIGYFILSAVDQNITFEYSSKKLVIDAFSSLNHMQQEKIIMSLLKSKKINSLQLDLVLRLLVNYTGDITLLCELWLKSIVLDNDNDGLFVNTINIFKKCTLSYLELIAYNKQHFTVTLSKLKNDIEFLIKKDLNHQFFNNALRIDQECIMKLLNKLHYIQGDAMFRQHLSINLAKIILAKKEKFIEQILLYYKLTPNLDDIINLSLTQKFASILLANMQNKISPRFSPVIFNLDNMSHEMQNLKKYMQNCYDKIRNSNTVPASQTFICRGTNWYDIHLKFSIQENQPHIDILVLDSCALANTLGYSKITFPLEFCLTAKDIFMGNSKIYCSKVFFNTQFSSVYSLISAKILFSLDQEESDKLNKGDLFTQIAENNHNETIVLDGLEIVEVDYLPSKFLLLTDKKHIKESDWHKTVGKRGKTLLGKFTSMRDKYGDKPYITIAYSKLQSCINCFSGIEVAQAIDEIESIERKFSTLALIT